MKQINRDDRLLLQTIRVCEWFNETLEPYAQTRPEQQLRVCVPERFSAMFSSVQSHGGTTSHVHLPTLIERVSTSLIGTPYFRKSLQRDATLQVNCSTFTKEVFACLGIHLPKYSVDQSYLGSRVHSPSAGCLVFFKNSFPIRDPDRSIGHVSIALSEQHIVHASPEHGKVVFENIPDGVQMVRCIVPQENACLVTLPPEPLGLETALDLARWLKRPEIS